MKRKNDIHIADTPRLLQLKVKNNVKKKAQRSKILGRGLILLARRYFNFNRSDISNENGSHTTQRRDQSKNPSQESKGTKEEEKVNRGSSAAAGSHLRSNRGELSGPRLASRSPLNLRPQKGKSNENNKASAINGLKGNTDQAFEEEKNADARSGNIHANGYEKPPP